ncbi:MAG: hypothetical protein LBJ46_09130 [Planctomycetota bacterium]|jgi:hypothetical protein|nr:hypothetical protein [Planctomycetota bacterium]
MPSRLAFHALLLSPILFCVAGCGRKPEAPPPPDGISRFPTGEILQEGDILLGRSYGLIGAMFATYSQEGGRFSHGSMVYRDRDAGRMMVLNYRPTGMEDYCTPEDYFTRYNRLALVRYNKDLNEARPKPEAGLDPDLRGGAALSASAMRWLAKNREKRIPPDYRLDHDDQSAMFCLELPSTAYRENRLPDPFFKARKAAEDPLLSKANQLFKADIVEIRSPSSVLDNPDFTLVAEWLRPDYDLREEALNEEAINVIVEEIAAGYEPRQANFWGRMKIRQIFIIYHTVTTLMFWMPKQDLPDFIDYEVVNNAFMLYNYVARTKKMVKKRLLAETTPCLAAQFDHSHPILQYVRRIVRETAAELRDTYIVLPDRPDAYAAPCQPCSANGGEIAL